MNTVSGGTVYWLFGRGASIECGLTWTVPKEWSSIPREEKIERIKEQLRIEMDRPEVAGEPYQHLLEQLENRTKPEWGHLFITTNWDFLLQREIQALNLEIQPHWMRNSWVAHMNGSIEVISDESNRSTFLLEEDPSSLREWKPESEVTYGRMIWGRFFVVIGVSFECDTDRFLLKALGDVANNMIVGESHWLVLNPNREHLEKVVRAIRQHLPEVTITPIPLTLGKWLNNQMPELETIGILA